MEQFGMSLERCKRNIILLSLDITISTYEHMGLIIPKEKKLNFAKVLRTIIRDMGGASVSIPIPPTLVENVLQIIEARLGKHICEQYLDWSVYIYEESPADHPHTQAWSTILTWCSGSPSRWALLELPKEISGQLRTDYKKSTDCCDIEELFAKATAEQLSQWDINILNDRKFEDGYWNPTLAVEAITFRYRFRCALISLLDQLSNDEINSFWKSVRAVGFENELTRIEDLKWPIDLREPVVENEYE